MTRLKKKGHRGQKRKKTEEKVAARGAKFQALKYSEKNSQEREKISL